MNDIFIPVLIGASATVVFFVYMATRIICLRRQIDRIYREHRALKHRYNLQNDRLKMLRLQTQEIR